MENALKKIGFLMLTLVLTAGIYWLVFVDKATRQDALEYSLNLLGKKLLAMVPDTTDKQPVQTLYDQFVQQATYQQIPAERIERVAANILNLSNADAAVTPEQAEAVLRWAMNEPVQVVRSGESTIVISGPRTTAEATVAPPPPPRPRPEDLKKTGERIKAMYTFNLALQKAMEEQQQLNDQRLKMVYRVDDGLKIVVDPKLKLQFASPENKQLYITLQRLEKEKQLIWQENWQQEIQKQQEQLQQQLEKLKELQNLRQLESLKSLEALKNLEVLSTLPAIMVDSIQIGQKTQPVTLPNDSNAAKK
jgi:hypothetical protein